MRYYYKDEKSDFYHPKLLNELGTWVIGSFTGLVLLSVAFARGFKGYLIIQLWFLFFLGFIGLLILWTFIASKNLGSFERIFSYLGCCWQYMGRIDTAFLNSQNKFSMKHSSYRILPKIWLYKDDSNLRVRVEKLAGTYEEDLPKLAELVSSAIGESWRITSKVQEDNQSWFKFTLSPVNQDLLFVPKTLQDLQQPLYKAKLQNNLVLDFSKNPHLACFGKTNSGKSTVLWSIVLQVIGSGSLYFEDFKDEFSVLSTFYPKDHFATTSVQILDLLERLVKIMNQRKKIISEEAKKRGVIGLTGYDMRMKPIYFVADEWASVISSFSSSKDKKHCEALMRQLLMQARSCSIIILYASQSPSTDVLSNQNRSQFGTYLLLGSANADVQRMAFGQVATTGNVGHFSGYYLKSTADMDEPQKFYVPDIFSYNLNQVEVFKEIYEKGKQNEIFD